MTSIAIISTPWPLFHRPSIQLGALKAFVRARLPRIEVHAHPIYLGVAQALGYNLYQTISETTWLGESLYAALLYPDRAAAIERFWVKRSSRAPSITGYDFARLCRTIEAQSIKILDPYRWDEYLLTGFSICFSQLTSSLYFIREVKKRAPNLKVVVGGSACAGEMGKSLLKSFPDIDTVIRGEGELPLVHLIKTLTDPRDVPDVPPGGLLSRDGDLGTEDTSQVTHLDTLPIPDYDDYFHALRSPGSKKAFFPKIPMEISRGCWWRKTVASKGTRGCAFCNLNLQWKGYRAKSHDRILEELEVLTRKHEGLSVSFMDNLLPAENLEVLFRRIQKMGKDLRLFSEIRAGTSRRVLAAMAGAGMGEVQVGIESLSTALLRKLNKGTTAMDNLEIMRDCETPGLPDLTGNLILDFPSSDSRDVAETLAALDYALPFRPLKGISFWLGYGSPVWQSPGAYGIKRVGNHPYYRHLFPAEIVRGLRLMVQGYQGGVREQHRLWQPVREKIKDWHKSYRELHQEFRCDPILSYLDGRDFLMIRQRRPGALDMTHRLRGTSRNIYLFCHTQRTMARIVSQFPGFPQEQVAAFLRMMVDKGLMFNEEDRYLSLAVPGRIRQPHSLF